MALSKEEILKYRKQYNITPTKPSGPTGQLTPQQRLDALLSGTPKQTEPAAPVENAGLGTALQEEVPKKKSFWEDLKGDVKETVSNIGTQFEEGADKIGEIDAAQKKGEQGKFRSLWHYFGAGADTAADAIGELGLGLGKAALPQKAEDFVADTAEAGVQKVMGTETAQNAVKDFTDLGDYLKTNHPAAFRDVESAWGVVKLGGEVAAIGEGSKLATDVAKKAKSGVDDVVTKVGSKVGSKVDDVVTKGKNVVTNKIDDTVDDIASAIRPVTDKKQIITEAKKGLAGKEGILQKTVTKPEKKYLDIADDLAGKGIITSKDPVKNLTAIQKYQDDLIKEVTSSLKDNKKIFNEKTLRKFLKSQVDDIDILEIDPKQLAQFKERLLDDMLKQIDVHDMEGLWKARIKMDDILEKRLNIFSGAPSTKKEMGLQLRRAVNDFIGNADDAYKPLMKRMSGTYDVIDNLANNVAKIHGKDVLDNILYKIGKTPIIRAAGETTKRFLGR